MKKKVADYEASIKTKIDEFEIREDGSGCDNDSKDDLAMHYCPVCPARFLFTKEIVIHVRFHELNLPFKCESCSYTARQKSHLMAHQKVHTDEYQERTRTLSNKYPLDKDYPKPKVAVVLGAPSESGWTWKSESVWVVVKNEMEEPEGNEDKQNETKKKKPLSCDKCPAGFFKEVSLQCHKKLHGGPGPYKCKYCDYAVKTYANLMKHEEIHDNSESPIKQKQKTEAEKGSPQKPIPAPNQEDPEYGSLIFGNPDFVYPTYMKNGRLREKRYKCHKCPSAFEKREQYKIHLTLHGSKQRYKCEKCDYSVKYFANYSQHLKKHSLNEAAKKEHGAEPIIEDKDDEIPESPAFEKSRKSLKMSVSVADKQTMLLMQARNTSQPIARDSTNVDVVSRCPYCPYANNRKDGVSSHIKCHIKKSAYMCKYCDYSVPQPHFLREHVKVHFSKIKFIKPTCYVHYDRLEIWSEPVDSNHNKEKTLLFKADGVGKKDRFFPPLKNPVDFDKIKGRVYINLKTGEEEVEMDDEMEGEGEAIRENGHVEGEGMESEETLEGEGQGRSQSTELEQLAGALEGTEETTEGPEDPSEGPEDPSEGPEDPSEGPEEPMEGLEEPSEGPEEPMEGLEEPTEGAGELGEETGELEEERGAEEGKGEGEMEDGEEETEDGEMEGEGEMEEGEGEEMEDGEEEMEDGEEEMEEGEDETDEGEGEEEGEGELEEEEEEEEEEEGEGEGEGEREKEGASEESSCDSASSSSDGTTSPTPSQSSSLTALSQQD